MQTTATASASTTTGTTAQVNAADQTNATAATDQNNPLQQLLDYVGYLHTNYTIPWQDAVRKQADFFKKVTRLETTIANAIKPSGDKEKPINVNCKEIYDATKAIYDDYDIPAVSNGGAVNSKAYLYASPALVDAGRKDAAYQQALDWAKEFGAPASSIVMQTITTNGPETLYRYYVQIDRSPLQGIMAIFNPAAAGNADQQQFDPASYNEMDTAKTGHTQLVKDFMNIIQQQFSSKALPMANSIADLFAKCNERFFNMIAEMLG